MEKTTETIKIHHYSNESEDGTLSVDHTEGSAVLTLSFTSENGSGVVDIPLAMVEEICEVFQAISQG